MPVRVPVVPEYITVHLGVLMRLLGTLRFRLSNILRTLLRSEIYPSFSNRCDQKLTF